MAVLVATAVLAGACAALWGWGRLAFRLAGAVPAPWPVAVAVGLAALLFLGGVANLGHVALPVTLHLVWGTGVALAASEAWGLRRPAWRRDTLLLLLPAALVLGFLALTHLPPTAYNPHDDIEKYFGHVVRMLQTGTVFGSPLSALGSETLGGMAWLSGVLVQHVPMRWYAAVDGIVGLFLCFMLVAFGPPADKRSLLACLLAQAAIVAVPLQLTNAAPFFLGMAVLIALTLLAAREEPWTLRRALLPGLLCAGLVALKPTFALPAALHALGYAAALAVVRERRREALLVLLGTGAWGALFVAPWFLLHAPHYLGPWMAEAPRAPWPDPFRLLTFTPMPLGGSPAGYLLLAGAVALSALLAAVALGRGAMERRRAALAAAVVASAGAFLIMVVLLGPAGNGTKTHIRYAIPWLVAGWASVLALTWAVPEAGGRRRAAAYAPLGLAALLMVPMAGELAGRVRQVALAGTWMSYVALPTVRWHTAYTDLALSPAEGARIRRAQAVVPEGAGVVAWVGSPMHLDFRRNRIYETEPAGTAMPWAIWPDVQYVLWQYDGRAVRGRQDYEDWLREGGRNEHRIAEKAYAFTLDLERRARAGEILYDDGEVLVFRRR